MTTGGMPRQFDRRRFLQSAAGAGAVLTYTPALFNMARAAEEPDPINVAVIGAGAQGRLLAILSLRIPGVKLKAVCDIWKAYNLKWLSRRLQALGHPVSAYTDYEEMLTKEDDLDAVIVANPDCWHARHTIASLEAGLHVYCETPMAHTLADARSMLRTARRTGKLLQIGQQRRSNPRYRFCCETLLKETGLLGQITAGHSQWNRPVHPPIGWPKRYGIDKAILNQYGYESMHEYRNWRWYRKLGGGPLAYVATQQMDICNWFLGAKPKSVQAGGCAQYYRKEGFELHDTVMAIYEYATSQGPVHLSYQMINTNSSFEHFESLMGTEGTLVISEMPHLGEVYRELRIPHSQWQKWIVKGYLESPAGLKPIERDLALPMYIVRETPPPFMAKSLPYKIPVQTDGPHSQAHLENFFDAIRGQAQLNCPAEVGYETAVTVLKVNEAIEAGRKLSFTPEEFIV